MATRERRELSDVSDRSVVALAESALTKYPAVAGRIAIAAVGGYGRGELSPGSDLDLLVLHDGTIATEILSEFINAFLYPLWNGGRAIDHSVRTRNETRAAAGTDIRVAQGLLDIRFLWGSEALVLTVATDALDDWRKNFKRLWPQVLASISERRERSGELAFLLEPDLKEARGGLRDINTLRAIAKSDAVPVALERLATAESLLINVRDCLHQVSGRHRDQLLFTEQDKVASALKFSDADALLLEVAKSARSVDYVMALTVHRIENSDQGFFARRRKPVLVSKGLYQVNEEIAIASEYELVADPGLGLRAAATAAQRGLPLSIESCIRLADEFVDLPTPWPRQSREDLVALIGAGAFMVNVWEALDQSGLIEKWIPEWGHVRFLPQRNALHRHTVDRHMLETAVRATNLIRQVHRPDLLLVAALFHDLGKGFGDLDHSEYGETLIAPLAIRMGFSESDAQTLAVLVRHHLLLSSVATRRDLDDPLTISYVLSHVDSAETLELLHALSIADGEATGRTAWSGWKAGLVADLVSRCLAAMSGIAPAPQLELTADQIVRSEQGILSLEIAEHEGNYEIEIIAPDQVGLLSAVAGVLSISRFDVRSARTRTLGNSAVMKWIVNLDANSQPPESEALQEILQRALTGEIDLTHRIEERINNYRKRPGIPVAPPVVSVIYDIATSATVLEVRMHDRPGILYTVARAVSRFRVDIRAAIVATLGAEAFDTIYVTDLQGQALTAERAVLLANQIENILLTH